MKLKKKYILGIIPARGGSVGIKNKNIFKIFGKELIKYTLEDAKKSTNYFSNYSPLKSDH